MRTKTRNMTVEEICLMEGYGYTAEVFGDEQEIVFEKEKVVN